MSCLPMASSFRITSGTVQQLQYFHGRFFHDSSFARTLRARRQGSVVVVRQLPAARKLAGYGYGYGGRDYSSGSTDEKIVKAIINVDDDQKRLQSVGDDDDDYDAEPEEDLIRTFTLGKLVDSGSGLMFRQNFIIRHYEVGPDKAATVETLMGLMQEAGTNHAGTVGLIHRDELVANHMMRLMNLVWVVCRVHVQFYQYCSWRDTIHVDTWLFHNAGKYSFRRDWILQDHSTKQTIAKATSAWMMMNTVTKRVSKLPKNLMEDFSLNWNNKCAFEYGEEDTEKIIKLTDETADRIHSGITPKWNDMDANQHVNHIKYTSWILENVPVDVWANYNLKGITFEYRRECREDEVLESLSRMKQLNSDTKQLESTHLLRKQDDKLEIVRARITWQSNNKHQLLD
ncbi:hypothetical protein Dimus_032350 [Dionaea muscipula]